MSSNIAQSDRQETAKAASLKLDGGLAGLTGRALVTAIAKLYGISPAMIYKAGELQRIGSPDLIAAVDAGRLSLHRALQAARENPPDRRLAAAIAKPARRPNLDALDKLKRQWTAADERTRNLFAVWIAEQLESGQ
jgi:hypothetical protein